MLEGPVFCYCYHRGWEHTCVSAKKCEISATTAVCCFGNYTKISSRFPGGKSWEHEARRQGGLVDEQPPSQKNCGFCCCASLCFEMVVRRTCLLVDFTFKDSKKLAIALLTDLIRISFDRHAKPSAPHRRRKYNGRALPPRPSTRQPPPLLGKIGQKAPKL